MPGLPLAMAFAEAGFDVTGIDLNAERVAAIARAPLLPGRRARRALRGRRRAASTATTDYSAVLELDALTICVPTPLSKTRTPDLSYVVAAAESVAEQLSPGQLVILQSTTYPGTTEQVDPPDPRARRRGRSGTDFFLGYAPERVDPGNKHWDVHTTPKLVAGVTRGVPAAHEAALRDDRRHGRPGLEPDGGRDGEAAREHLPRGQHRARQRAGADVRPARDLRLGGHRRRRHASRSASCRTTRARAWAATASRSCRTSWPGGCASTATRRSSSTPRTRSTRTCRTSCCRRSATRSTTRGCRSRARGSCCSASPTRPTSPTPASRRASRSSRQLVARGGDVRYCDPYIPALELDGEPLHQRRRGRDEEVARRRLRRDAHPAPRVPRPSRCWDDASSSSTRATSSRAAPHVHRRSDGIPRCSADPRRRLHRRRRWRSSRSSAGDDVVLADNWHATEPRRSSPSSSARGARVETADIRDRAALDALLARGPGPRPAARRAGEPAALRARPRLHGGDQPHRRAPGRRGGRRLRRARARATAARCTSTARGLSGEVGPDAPYGEQGDLAHLSKVYAELALGMHARRGGFGLAHRAAGDRLRPEPGRARGARLARP